MSAEGFVWNPAESADAKAAQLYELVLKIFGKIAEVNQEIGKTRAEALAGDAALRETVEGCVGELKGASEKMREWLEARDRRATRVDARGLVPIALSIIMTGLAGGLASVGWLGWIFVIGAPVVTICMGLWVKSDWAITGRSPA